MVPFLEDGREAFHQLQQHDLILRLVWGGILHFNSLVSLALTISGLFESVKQPL
jgi:hypothetical protein